MVDYSKDQNRSPEWAQSRGRMREQRAGSRGAASGEDEKPLLSIVVTARNDDHGGSFLQRMQMFVNGLLEQAARYRLNSELIIVEWNPPADRPRLADALRWPAYAGPCTVRIIGVPSAIHHRYAHSAKLGLFQMIAKNVGIRRSHGHFVLCTNIDVLFSREVMLFFASGRLGTRDMYRVDRLDVSSDIPVGASLDEQLEFCDRHVVRVNVRWRTVPPDEVGWIGMSRAYWRKSSHAISSAIARLPNRVWGAIKKLPVATAGAAAVIVEAAVWIFGHPLTESAHAFRTYVGGALRSLRAVLHRVAQLFERRVMMLHTNACGDFTLLSRDEWFRLRGYPEWQMYSFHLDSILCYMAHYDGAREVVLKRKMGVYHIDHHSGWSPEGADTLVNRMRSMGVPILDYAQLCSLVSAMHKEKSPLISNDEGWGLAAEDLVETNPVTGHTGHARVTGARWQAVRP